MRKRADCRNRKLKTTPSTIISGFQRLSVSAFKKEVAKHSTALRKRHYRCYLPVLAEFVRLPMHGAWPTRN
tara:strand:+ start:1346 stop:1558 length:213 start_codon:yes stop_codon:yes gene_type:complete